MALECEFDTGTRNVVESAGFETPVAPHEPETVVVEGIEVR
jgi:hypothetical protein